jgi:hypothetical protein
MLLRNLFGRAFLLSLVAISLSLAPLHLRAQDDTTPAPEKHGRKYKAPPDTSHIEITVLKDSNKKPIMNAAVIFHPTKDGTDEGNLEIKTDPEGKASIDVIPTGSKVTIQVIADGFSTFAGQYQINETNRAIVISMIRPQAQVSTYVDNTGKPADLKPGVQDPSWLTKAKPAPSPTRRGSPTPASAPPVTPAPAAAPSSSTPPQP